MVRVSRTTDDDSQYTQENEHAQKKEADGAGK
jgi:hypothetical protein